jgi:hypothetical protein
MSYISTPAVVTSAGTKTVLNVTLDAYQVKDSFISNKLYLDGSSYFNTLGTAVATGTQATRSTDFPLSGDLYNTVYYFSDTEAQRPLVGRQSNYQRITAPAINDGFKYAFSRDLSSENFFAIVVKSSGTSVAGKVKIRSTASNESVCAFTTSATANTWERKIFDFKNASTAGVTFTGTPNFAAISEIEITLDAASNVDVVMFYFVNNYLQLIGNQLKVRQLCVSEYTMERTLDTADLLCRQQVEQSTGTAKSVMFNIGTKKQDISVEGMALGQIVQQRTAYLIETINSVNVGNKAISAGAVTIGAGLNIDSVYIGDQPFTSYHTATAVPVNGYHYNSSTGVFTFSTVYNGKVPKITINNAITMNSVQDRELELGYVGVFRLEVQVNDTKVKQYEAKKAQLMYNDTAVNEDFDQENYSYKVYKDSDGVYMTKFLQS